MRRFTSPATLVLAVALLAGCGSSDDGSQTTQTATGTVEKPPRASGAEAPAGAAARNCDALVADTKALRVTGVSCAEGKRVMLGWEQAEGCGLIGNASRGSCAVRPYRCLATRVARGVSISCSRPGRSIAFLAS